MSVMTVSAGRDIVCMSVFGERHSMYVCGERNSMSMRLCLRGGHSMSVMTMSSGRDIVCSSSGRDIVCLW